MSFRERNGWVSARNHFRVCAKNAQGSKWKIRLTDDYLLCGLLYYSVVQFGVGRFILGCHSSLSTAQPNLESRNFVPDKPLVTWQLTDLSWKTFGTWNVTGINDLIFSHTQQFQLNSTSRTVVILEEIFSRWKLYPQPLIRQSWT